MNDLYPSIIKQVANIAPRNLISLQYVNKYFYLLAHDQFVRIFLSGFNGMHHGEHGKHGRKSIQYVSKSINDICCNLEVIKKYPYQISINVSNFYTISHNNFPFGIRVQDVSVPITRGRVYAAVSILMGKYIMYLQIANNRYMWIRGIKYRQYHTKMINFLRRYLLEIYTVLVSE